MVQPKAKAADKRLFGLNGRRAPEGLWHCEKVG